jgi:hypothetical protein
MTSQTLTKISSSYRSAGWAAIASGSIGIIAAICIFAAVALRSVSPSSEAPLSKFHDVGLILQFPLMTPLIIALYNLSLQRLSGMGWKTAAISIGAICFVVVCLLLAFPKIVAGVLYMLPMGIFGVSLIFINWRMKGILSKGLRWFGIIVGLGLAITGVSLAGYAIFVSTIILQIPAATEEAIAKVPQNTANLIVHQLLFIGSFMGVLTLPFWTILTGRKLLRERS